MATVVQEKDELRFRQIVKECHELTKDGQPCVTPTMEQLLAELKDLRVRFGV